MIVKIDEKDKDKISGGMIYDNKSEYWRYKVLDDKTGRVLDYWDTLARAKQCANRLGQSTELTYEKNDGEFWHK